MITYKFWFNSGKSIVVTFPSLENAKEFAKYNYNYISAYQKWNI